MRIAYFGDENSHTFAAAKYSYPDDENVFLGRKSIGDCFDAVENGSADIAVVPLENSVEGTVRETLNCFFERTVYICREINMHITHSLVVKRGAEKQDIRTLYSHYQVLSQCRGYIERNLPGAEVVPVASTSDALCRITDKSIAAIARKSGGIHTTVLEKNVEDSQNNETRFAAVCLRPHFDGGKCSVIFDTADTPGALMRVLTQMYDDGINMTKLESRPKGDRLGRYVFFSDFYFDGSKEGLTEFLGHLSAKTNYLKFLGKYNCVTL